jgi:hypothetical protein
MGYLEGKCFFLKPLITLLLCKVKALLLNYYYVDLEFRLQCSHNNSLIVRHYPIQYIYEPMQKKKKRLHEYSTNDNQVS